MFIYPIYYHNWRNISTIYIYVTRLASNEIFSPSNIIHREVGRAEDLSAPWAETLSQCLYRGNEEIKIIIMNIAVLWIKTQHLESQIQTGTIAKIQAFWAVRTSHCTAQVLTASKNHGVSTSVALACLTLWMKHHNPEDLNLQRQC